MKPPTPCGSPPPGPASSDILEEHSLTASKPQPRPPSTNSPKPPPSHSPSKLPLLLPPNERVQLAPEGQGVFEDHSPLSFGPKQPNPPTPAPINPHPNPGPNPPPAPPPSPIDDRLATQLNKDAALYLEPSPRVRSITKSGIADTKPPQHPSSPPPNPPTQRLPPAQSSLIAGMSELCPKRPPGPHPPISPPLNSPVQQRKAQLIAFYGPEPPSFAETAVYTRFRSPEPGARSQELLKREREAVMDADNDPGYPFNVGLPFKKAAVLAVEEVAGGDEAGDDGGAAFTG